ncbi:SusC/RagA family TonB-linked outer membrane protein [Mariniflexile sp. HNIBRBA6329]|uniref:SusC/RagA family TonB-linked outer membrane protein n=1 Tax=Mariniflexile sp. HNIBRBA6329 TaxID=3373088 RepID=UPI0037452008
MKNNLICTGRQLLYCMICLFIISFSSNALETVSFQQSEIHGTITDIHGVPLVGVSILIKGTQKGTVSDFNGSYNILVNEDDVLLYSFLGFKSQEISTQGNTLLNVRLETDITTLNTVEVNAGYYTVKEREGTGNISKLEAKTIEKQPVNNPLAAMQGHLTGVNIVQNTGVPGAGYSIEIRGKNFINGSTEPLYIVDGVPFGGQSLASIDIAVGINAANISPLNAINPSDIASIEVLKDADATAIYGARAANGVVLITTKKGKVGKTRFQASLSNTLGQVSHFLDLMNTEQYLEVRKEGIMNEGFEAFLENPAFDFVWPDLKTWDQNRYTDWQKELIGGTAYRNKLQLSVSGGSSQTQFLISGAYQKETTVFPGNSNYKKASVQNNINHQSIDGHFKINMTTLYTQEHNKMPRTDFTGLAYTLIPNAPAIYDEIGNLNWENNTWNNPLASLLEDYQVKINTLMSNALVTYQLIPNLEFKTNLGFNKYELDSYRILPSTSRNPKLGYTAENYSSITTNSATRSSWIIEPQLHWKQQWGNINLNILVGTTFQQQSTDQLVQKGTGFPTNNLLMNLSAAKKLEVREDSESQYNYQAIFGRINFSWNEKYIFNLTGRRDGSSRFGPGKQFGNFGAIGIAWLFSEEVFLKQSPFISFGKFRGSYGTTGSDNIGDYKFLDTYSVTGFNYNGKTIIEPTGIFNPLFGWEVNKKLEIALELGFFKDRVLLNAAWYQNRSSNQLIGTPLAATTGFKSLTANFDATVENTGFEFDLQTKNIQGENLQWTATFNITLPKNRLVEFLGLETSTFANRYIIGQPLSIIHLYHALGVDSDTGIYQFEDYNQDDKISSLNDKNWIEDLAPQFYGGIGNTLSYKNLSLDIFFQFKKQMAFNSIATINAPGFNVNGPVALLDRWQKEGDNKPVMRAVSGLDPSVFNIIDYQRESSAAVSDASFIRLRNISITYRIPKKISKGLDLSVYLQGQNLLTITGYDGPDPEQSSQIILPPLRQMTLGVQLGL